MSRPLFQKKEAAKLGVSFVRSAGKSSYFCFYRLCPAGLSLSQVLGRVLETVSLEKSAVFVSLMPKKTDPKDRG